MSDTESFEHAMAEMRKIVADDCYMTRCNMYDDDCHQCQQDILDRMQRAHDSELAQARDPQRLRWAKPNTFDGAIEALREFRWQHATNDEDAVPYINAVKEMHDHELEHVRKAEYARGYHDSQHSMDAEHYAVALRLMHLPLDGGSHENLSQIARAVWHSDFGWTQGACKALRDELVRLMGGVHKPDVELPTYDVLGNERHKAVCELRKIHADAGGFVKALANALGVEWQAPRVVQTIAEVRDRLIHLLGGDEPDLQKSPIFEDSGNDDAGEITITDELRKFATDPLLGYASQELHVKRITVIADRIDERFNHAMTSRSAEIGCYKLRINQLEQERDELIKKFGDATHNVRMWRGKAMQLTDVVDRYVGRCDDLLELLRDAADDFKNASYGWNYAVVVSENITMKTEVNKLAKERDELQVKLDAIREAVDAV